MNFGYYRAYADEPQNNPVQAKLLGLVEDDRFLFHDMRGATYEHSQYDFLCNMLRPGDVLYVDELDSLANTFDAMAAEWRRLTDTLQVDVVVLSASLTLDSRNYKATGAQGAQLEQQLLALLHYASALMERQAEERRHDLQHDGKKVGRPTLQWDWDLFDATAQRWADGEISVDEACDIMDSARSSWYKYVKERGFVRKRSARAKKAVL